MPVSNSFTLTNPPSVDDLQTENFAKFAQAQHRKIVSAQAKELTNIVIIALYKAAKCNATTPIHDNVGGVQVVYTQSPEGHYKTAISVEQFDPAAVEEVLNKFSTNFKNSNTVFKPHNWQQGLTGRILCIES